MPPLILELATMINRMPPTEHWKRLRIAVTQAELDEMVAFFFANSKDNPDGPFAIHAIRGVPILVEEHPTHPLYVVVRA